MDFSSTRPSARRPQQTGTRRQPGPGPAWGALLELTRNGQLPGQPAPSASESESESSSPAPATTPTATPAPAVTVTPGATSDMIGFVLVGLCALGLVLAIVETLGGDLAAGAVAVIVCAAGAGAWVVNRRSSSLIAPLVALVVLYLALVVAMLSAPNLQLSVIYLPTLDFFVLPAICAAAMLGRRPTLICAVLSGLAIIALYFGMPPAPDLRRDWQLYGPVLSLASPLALSLITAAIAYGLARPQPRPRATTIG